jgi:formylglycine-generating enzyme required for sulfatase activity
MVGVRAGPLLFIAGSFVACGAFGEGEDAVRPSPDAGTSEPAASDASSADAIAADAKEAGDALCPMGIGPAMRVVELAGGRSICIDLTEVTSSQYATFRNTVLDLAPLTQRVPPACSQVALGGLSPPDPEVSELPRVNVSFCSAAFYCAAQGKRLCGDASEGRAIVFVDGTTEPPNEWELACADGKGSEFYPWGTQDKTTAVSAGCAVSENGIDATSVRTVGSSPACGPTSGAGPFDMIGNAWEWINVRKDVAGGASYSGVRGGAFDVVTVVDGCRSVHGIDSAPGAYADGRANVGFRCCANTL